MEHGTSLEHDILQQMSDAMIYADREGYIRMWNAAAEALFGFTREEAIGASLDLIIPEHLREPHWKAFYRAIEEGRSQYGRTPLFTRTFHKEKGKFYIDMGLAVVTDAEGNAQGSVAILRDATDRRDRERELRHRIQELEQQLKDEREDSE